MVVSQAAAESRQDLYPSRVRGLKAGLRERVDPVVYGDNRFASALSDESVAAYERNGFLAIESLLRPEEVAELNAELRRLVADPDVAASPRAVTEPESDEVRSIFEVHAVSRLFGWLARDSRLLEAARRILGSEVYLHQSRVNLKPGFRGKEFYWHSDFETWHVEDGLPRMRTVSVSVALTENYPYNGPLMLIPRSHEVFVVCEGETPKDNYRSSLKRQDLGVPDPRSLKQLVDRGGISAPTGPAGSTLFFDCNAMHGSNGNITPYPRSNAFFVYNSVENAPVKPFCGLPPRPDHIGNRSDFTPLKPLRRGS